MSDAYTTATLNSVQAAYDKRAFFALRKQLFFDDIADVKPMTPGGSSTKFTVYSDLAVVTTTLNESIDVDAVAVSDSQVTVTPTEHGTAVIDTFKLRETSFFDVDEDIANIVGYNAGESQDTLALIQLRAGSNVAYATGGATTPTGRTSVEPEDTLTAHDIRKAVAALRGAGVMTFDGNKYAGYMHSDVSVDLREETGAAAWVDPVNYSDAVRRWNGEIGSFEGVRFVETPRAPVFADAGSSTTLTDVYGTLILGRQALAKTWGRTLGPNPRVIIGPPTDKLRRLHTIGWHWFGAYGRFREAALRRIESSSSIGSN